MYVELVHGNYYLWEHVNAWKKRGPKKPYAYDIYKDWELFADLQMSNDEMGLNKTFFV